MISSTLTLGRSIVVGLGLHNKGFLNLAIGSGVTFNMADASIWEKIEHIARTTGTRDIPEYKKKAGYTYCADKFSLGGFTKLEEKEVSSVRIKECSIQIEMLVTEITSRKDYAIVECQIQGIFVDEKILYDDSHIDVNKWFPLIYKFRDYASTNLSLGTNFRFQEFKN